MGNRSNPFGEHAAANYDDFETEFFTATTPAVQPDWSAVLGAARQALSSTQRDVHPVLLALGWFALSMAALGLCVVLLFGWLIMATAGKMARSG